MKRMIKIVVTVLTFLLLGGAWGLWWNKHHNLQDNKNQIMELLTMADTNEYYWRDAKSESIICVRTTDGKEPDFCLTDEKGHKLDATVKKTDKGSYDILPPENGYKRGKDYFLELKDETYLYNEEQDECRRLRFRIRGPKTEEYKYSSAVKEIGQMNHADENGRIPIGGGKLAAGDILLGKDAEGEYLVYKIVEIGDKDALVEIPSYEEVFRSLRVTETYQADVDDVTVNPQLKAEIIANVKKSVFFKNLIRKAYAAETKDIPIDVTINKSSNDELELILGFTLTPESGNIFGMEELKNQTVKLQMKTTLSLAVDCDIDGTDWDICAKTKNTVSWEISIEAVDEENINNTLSALERKLSENIVEGEINLFSWKIPTGVPGLVLETEVNLFTELNLNAQLFIGQSCENSMTVGIALKDGKFTPYFAKQYHADDPTISLFGKAEAKAGIMLALKAELLCEEIAHIGFDIKTGLYADLAVEIPISEWKESAVIGGFFEAGLVLSADVTASVAAFSFESELLDGRLPLFSFGNPQLIRDVKTEEQKEPGIYDLKGNLLYSCDEVLDIDNEGIFNEIIDNDFIEEEKWILVLPDSVTAIGEAAVYQYKGLAGITIPDSVTAIGERAFRGCTGLTDITIPNSVTTIGKDAFVYCTGLTNITIPDSVTTIGAAAFCECTGLTNITIPNSVTTIGRQAFRGCTGLTDITIPNSMTTIGYGMFERCTSLVGITIPNSVTSIGDSAFYGCTSLVGITIPNSVTSIGGSAFYGCTSLTGITIPDSVPCIAESTFQECTSLVGITIPNSVTSIGDSAFYGCTSLVGITIPNSVTCIGASAFYGCSGLTGINIPDSLMFFGRFVFDDCHKLEKIYVKKDSDAEHWLTGQWFSDLIKYK